MFEPSAPIEPPLPPPLPAPRPPPASASGTGLKLIADVRRAQAQAWWTQGALYGAASFLILFFAGGLVANARPMLGQWLIVAAPLSTLAFLLFFGVFLVRRRVGDDERTARLLAERAPELSLDLLAAVELSRAMGKHEDFSPELAQAFLRDVDERASKRKVSSLLDPRPVRYATWALAGTLLAGALTLGMVAEYVVAGVLKAFASAEVNAITRREPITGDFELTYRYPEYTGLEPRSVPGTAGDIAGPAGTEVSLKTRADRDVDEAVLIVNGTRVPLTVKGRDLAGSFILDTTGQYHVAFVDGKDVEAEGPDLPIQVEADAAPQVKLLAPIDTIELDAKATSVTLQYEATDDYGLAGLELVFKPTGGVEKRQPLTVDEARAARGKLEWDVASLGLKPGGEVRYFLEAKDGNTVKGAQKGVSKTQVVKLYSAAEHRRQALRRAEVLWEGLVTHLADRQESPDRKAPLTPDALKPGAPIDERATSLSKSFAELADSLADEKEPMPDLVAALTIIGGELETDARFVAQRRAYLKRNADIATRANGTYEQTMAFALTSRLATDLANSEKNVLYLEALLDRARLNAIRELAKQLKDDRRELTRLVEEFQKTNDPKVQEALLEQMDQLKERMRELQERMSELAKGIRDDFMNQEALERMRDEMDLTNPLDEVERLVREGKADEALKKMQELSMQLDEMFDGLEKGADAAEENADPELAKDFKKFNEDLASTIEEEQKVADQTKRLKDKARQAAKERISKQGDQVKREVAQKLDELERSYQSMAPDRYGMRMEETQQKALQSIRNTKQALDANDFDLAAESARELVERARQLESNAEAQAEQDRAFHNPESVVKESKKLAERMARDERKSEDVAQQLEGLFPPASQSLDPAEQQQLKELAKQQQKLGEKGQQLKQQMQQLGEKAPIFDEDAQAQMDQAGQRMQSAGERLQAKDPGKGHGDQQGALQALRNLQQGMQQGQGKGGKGLPMPMRGPGRGRMPKDQKVEIPEEDPSANPREFRKDVMDAMKQGAPDRYKEQNKKYYEELVK
ncbi:MAG: DUF4175 family protein [Myxococcales bacterium]|nr:DUF4175 family protein [Myxococcales bacterium]